MRPCLFSAISSILCFSLGTAFAAKPNGTGNFRRAEALRFAGSPQYGQVIGLDRFARRTLPGHVVQAVDSGSCRVTLIKSPKNRRKPVTGLSTREAIRMGLHTPDSARLLLAAVNGGRFGAEDTPKLKLTGTSGRSKSYVFEQVLETPIKRFGPYGAYLVNTVVRSVTFSADRSAESAIEGDVGPAGESRRASRARHLRSH